MVVTNRQEIADLVLRFREILCSGLQQQVHAIVGYKGGSMPLALHWSDDVQMWMGYESAEDTQIGRYWTVFGLERPFPDQNMLITAEINFPMEGIDRRLGGAFVTTSEDDILVVHRGRIGGGRNGIGKSLFWDNYRGRTLTAIDGDRETDFAVIGALDSPSFAYQVRNFVAEVERIKNLR